MKNNMKNIFYLLIFLCFFPFPAMAADGWVNSPAAELSGELRDYYVKAFNYGMETAKPNENYSWKAQNASGIIIASEKYTSKSQATCRNYNEIFVLGDKKSSFSGVACKRNGEAGWCRLKPEDAHTCALETSPDAMDKILGDMGSAVDSTKKLFGY